MPKTRFISVILPLKLEWEPFYKLPADEAYDGICEGDRVKVRFANRSYSAVVSATDIEPETSISKIKEIEGIEDGLEKIWPEEIALWRNVAGYYLCTVGEVYKAAYPLSKINLEEAHASALQRARDRRERLLEGMRQKISRLLQRLEKKEEHLSKAKDGTKAKTRYAEEAEAIKAELSAAIAALDAAELKFHTHDQQIPAAPGMHDRGISLSDAQMEAYRQIQTAFSSSKPVLLHGITGSGKTEIYIRCAQQALASGKNVLYLVPEIALSRQLEERLSKHFADNLLVFHSAETAASRRSTAGSIRSGKGYIILGTRSSLFLPHHDLGLIIVDEEHDSSYKQDSPAPRYNGRDTALMLAVIHGCSIIMGSATPSLEEQYNCMTGRHTIVRLEERYHRSEDSDIEIIDTKAERKKRGMRGSFSVRLIGHIRKTLEEGGQVMILRSRRAWSTAMQCSLCGEIVRCIRCNVSMSLHKSRQDMMACHYCGHTKPYTGRCGRCGGELISLGAGTQKIEEEASLLFPEARIARLDSDSAQNKAYEARTIREFAEGKTDILIGTQMVTKGFDFSGVSLVAVIAADTLLGIQDFRADEKAVQMLEQFRGRCGRRGSKGLFVIQTSQPEHPVYMNIASGSTSVLSNTLLQERKDFGFPPFTRIVEISIRDINEQRIKKMSSMLADELRAKTAAESCGITGNPVTGPYAPTIDRIADHHIRCIRISLKKDRRINELKTVIRRTVMEFEKERKYEGYITINVDPS